MDDVVDEGHIIDAVEFYFNGEFDGKVPFKVFASVLELIAANSNMRCDSFKSHMIINKLSKFL